MAQNPQNAIIMVGHGNGCATMWSPNMGKPLVKMFLRGGPTVGLAVDPSGKYMVSASADRKVWDLRTYKRLHTYTTARPVSSIDVSQRGILGIGVGPAVLLWKDAFVNKAKSPYMRHAMPGCIASSI